MDSLQLYERIDSSDVNLFDVSLHNDTCFSSHILLAQRSPFWRAIFCNRSGLFTLASLESSVSSAVLQLYFRQVNASLQTGSATGSDGQSLNTISAKRVCKFVNELRANASTLLFPHFEEYLSFVAFLLDEQMLFALWVYFEELLSKTLTYDEYHKAMSVYFRYLWLMIECLSVTHRFHSHELIDVIIDYLLQNARDFLSNDHLLFISQQSNAYIQCTLAQYIEWMCVNPTPRANYGHSMPLSSVDACRYIDALDVIRKPDDQLVDKDTKKIRALMKDDESQQRYGCIQKLIEELVFVSLLMNYSFTQDQAELFYRKILSGGVVQEI